MADQPDAYGVIGNPVSHSLSPTIHRSFADQTGQSISYEAYQLPIDNFDAALFELIQQGLRGVNVTVPFKQQAWKICDQLSERAQQAGAVNTLSFLPDGDIAGDNTDGVGLIRDLTDNLDVLIKHRQVLILGAGGAVRGVLGPILSLSPASLVIANRSPDKAEKLAEDFAESGIATACAFDDLGRQKFDLIINGTAAGLNNEVPAIPDEVLGVNSVCYDMMYNIEKATAFVEWAYSRGASRAYDGLGMLVEQAAESFSIWRNILPETDEVRLSLRSK